MSAFKDIAALLAEHWYAVAQRFKQPREQAVRFDSRTHRVLFAVGHTAYGTYASCGECGASHSVINGNLPRIDKPIFGNITCGICGTGKPMFVFD